MHTNSLQKIANSSTGGFFVKNWKKKQTNGIYGKSKGNKLKATKDQSRKETSYLVIMRCRRYLKKCGNTVKKQNKIRHYMWDEFVKHSRENKFTVYDRYISDMNLVNWLTGNWQLANWHLLFRLLEHVLIFTAFGTYKYFFLGNGHKGQWILPHWICLRCSWKLLAFWEWNSLIGTYTNLEHGNWHKYQKPSLIILFFSEFPCDIRK